MNENNTKSTICHDIDELRKKFLEENNISNEEMLAVYKVFEFIKKNIGGINV